MSDGGFDIDELLRKRRNSINLFGNVTYYKTGYSVSYPYLSNDKVDHFQKSNISNNHESIISKNAKCEISKKKKSYLFSWGDIQGNDRRRLTDFLKSKYDLEWVKAAKIAKTNNGKTIMITAGKNFLSLNLNNENTEMNLKIDSGKTDKFVVKTENNKLNIYKKSIENFRNINIAGKIQEIYKCIDCLKKEKCKLEAQGSLDLCKKPFLLAT